MWPPSPQPDQPKDVAVPAATTLNTTTSTFRIGTENFLLNGNPHRVLSGALQYFRVHPDLWRDRIVKARQMGLNTIETYIAWNEHAPHPGSTARRRCARRSWTSWITGDHQMCTPQDPQRRGQVAQGAGRDGGEEARRLQRRLRAGPHAALDELDRVDDLDLPRALEHVTRWRDGQMALR